MIRTLIDEHTPWGFALQLIDSQHLPIYHSLDKIEDTQHFIRHGIEFNHWGRAIAYHFVSTDAKDNQYYQHQGRGFIRIPAEQIIHLHLPELIGQKRGIPWTVTSLARLKQLQEFADAAVLSARAGATQMGFVEYSEGFGPALEDDESVDIEVKPLNFQELPEGAHLKSYHPPYPNGEFAVFHKAMLRSNCRQQKKKSTKR